MTDDRDSVAFADARARTYELLSRIFAGDIEPLIALREDEARLRMLAKTVGADPEPLLIDADRDTLKRSYDELFAVPGPHYVPPFASAHTRDAPEDAPESPSAFARSDGGRLGGKIAQRSKTLYSQFGFTPERDEGIADHIAGQLEFAAHLAAAADTLSDDVPVGKARGEILTLLGWLDTFESAVARQDRLGVYTGVVGLAHSIVEYDRELFERTRPDHDSLE